MTIMIGLRGVQADYTCALFRREKKEAYPSKKVLQCSSQSKVAGRVRFGRAKGLAATNRTSSRG